MNENQFLVMNIPIELKNAVKKNELIVFTGAGLSYNLVNTKGEKLLGWGNLVEKILLHLQEKEYDTQHLITLYRKGIYEPITILDLIEKDKTLSHTVIDNYIKEFLDLDTENDYSIHEKICALSNKIITLNYDSAFENALPSLRKNRAFKNHDFELFQMMRNPQINSLFKLHGCFEDRKSMVLFPSNYRDLYDNKDRAAQQTLLTLKNILLNNTVLFIGTGMGDYQINTIFKGIKDLLGDYNPNHYIITKDSLDSNLDFLTAIKINDYNEIPLILDELIKILPEKQEGESKEVKKMKADLAAAHKRIQELENQDNPDANELLEEEALKYLSKGIEKALNGQFDESIIEYEQATKLKPDLSEAYYNWGNSLNDLAQVKEGDEQEILRNQSIEKFEKTILYNDEDYQAYNNLGTAIIELANLKEGKEREELIHDSIEKYRKAIKLSDKDALIYYNWGIALYILAGEKEGEERIEFFNQSIEKYELAIQNAKEYSDAYFNLGTVLFELAKTKKGEEKENLISRSIENYELAISEKRDNSDVYFCLGGLFGSQALEKEGEESKDLFLKAVDQTKMAISIKSDYPEAYCQWGVLLTYLAEREKGQKPLQLLKESLEKYKMAIEYDKDSHDIYDNWGNSLGKLASLSDGVLSEEYLKQAFEVLHKSVELGGRKYNLACCYAKQQNRPQAFNYLEESLKNKEYNSTMILNDEDWKAYLEDPDFLALIQKYKDE